MLMTDSSQYLDFLFEAGKKLPQFVSKSVTRVFGVRKDGESADYRGTALVCTFKERLAFVTANHVLTEIENSGNYKCIAFSATNEGFQARYERFPDIDVAVIIPETNIPIASKYLPWQAEISDFHMTDETIPFDYMLLYGFPNRFSRYSAFAQGVVSEGYTHCTWVRPRISQTSALLRSLYAEVKGYEPIPDEELKPFHFCLNFDEPTGPLKSQDGELITSNGILEEHAGLYVDMQSLPGTQPFGAFGLSGSPVWRFGAVEANWKLESWTVNFARLVGIVTHWNEVRHCLIATRFGDIASKLKEII